MALYSGSEKVSSQISTAQYADVTDLMKHMTIEVGDVGQVMLPLNENENKRRYLNGQVILQEQFKKFTEKLKKAVALYPSLACTETEWQSLRKADPDDQCGKFVIDNVNGTIRLPRVKYLVGNLNLYRFAEGMPNRRLVKIKRPTDSDLSWYHIYSDGWCEQGAKFNNAEAETQYTYKIPFAVTPHLIISRDRTARNSVATNTDFLGTWVSSKTGFKTWGNWNGFMLSYYAQGYVSIPDSTQQYSNSIESQFESPYYIQVSTGVDYEVDVTNKITNNNPYAFGMIQRSNARLNNVSWLESNGNFHSGVAYPDFYEWLLKNYNTPTDDITVKLSTDSGVTEYDYVLNTTDRTFKLPTLLGDETVPGYTNLNWSSYVTTTETDFPAAPYNGYLTFAGNGTATSGYLRSRATLPYIQAGAGQTTTQTYRRDSIFVKKGEVSHMYISAIGGLGSVYLMRAESGYKHLYFYVGEAEQNLDLINVGNMAENFATVSSKLDEISTASEYMTGVETHVNEMSTTVSTFDERMTNVDNHLVGLTETVEGMADVQTQMGEIATQMEEVTVKMEEVNTVADNISNFTKRYVTETGKTENSWYTLYNDGWCEQSIDVKLEAKASNIITLPRAFTDTAYTLLIRQNHIETNNLVVLQTKILTEQTIEANAKLHTSDTYYDRPCTFYACGYTTLPTDNSGNNEGVLNPDDLEDLFG